MKKKLSKNLRETHANVATDSLFNASVSISNLHQHQPDMSTLVENLNFQVDKILSGTTKRLETMLATQAQTLDALFHCMLQKASTVSLFEKQMHIDLALKAQKHCRQTISALVEMKSPKKTMFIQQQNNALNQQINTQQISENLANELKEVPHECLDARTSETTIAVNPAMETVAVRRRKNAGR